MNYTPGLYIVSTPIGNLNDITIRALEILRHSDVILCEDSRVSAKLLSKHNINTPLKIYNDNCTNVSRETIKQLIIDNNIVSLISDAGTPLISDPGYKLIRDLKNDNLHIDVIPGACAVIAALTLSALPTDKFLFAGFVPKTLQHKQKFFMQFVSINASLIFYETAHRLIASIKVAIEVFGDREANIGRELTKLYQDSRSEKLSVLLDHYIPNLSQTIDFIRSKLSLILLRILSAIICHVSSKKLLILSLNS